MEFTVRSARTFAALALAVAVAATVAADGSLGTWAPEAPARAELRAVSTRFDGTRSTVLIEASEPVAYVTSQPDPLTVLVDLRNVRGGQMGGVLGPLPPVADVDVEEAVAGDGAPVARVRVSLAHAATHRVRSSRNMILRRSGSRRRPARRAVRRRSSRWQPRAEALTAARHRARASRGQRRAPSATMPRRRVRRSHVSLSSRPRLPRRPPRLQASPRRQRFTGEPVTLDFQGADLRAVLRNFAEISGLNIVIDPTHHRHGRRLAARRALGSGARHHPQGEQARLCG